MRYFVFVSIFIFALSACKTKHNLQTPLRLPSIIKVNSLEVANFAEKMLGLGSKADEIILFIFEDTGENQLLRWKSELLIFDNANTIYPIPFQTDVKQGDTFRFILIEVDTERTVEELLSIIQQCPYPCKEANIKKAIDEDDLLGLKELKIQPMERINVLEFWGVHLLDEYRYILKIE